MANVSSSNGLEKRPKLRFPGFDEPWKCSTLSQLFDYERPDKYIVSSENYAANGNIPVLTANQSFILGYTDDADGIYQKGEVIVFDDFTCDIKYANFPFKVKSSAIKLLTAHENMPIYFGYSLLRHINYKPMGHARHWISVLQSYMTSIPSLSEQQKISDFLRLIDQRIAYQTKYIETLKKYKRGAVKKLLSPKSCPLKNARWTTAKIGELGSFVKGAPLSKADISENGTPFILYGELYTTYNEVVTSVKRRTQAQVDEIFLSRVGDVVIPTSGETPEEISTASCVMLPGVILAGDLNIFRSDKVDGRIMSYLLNHIVNAKVARIAQGKSVVHIQASELGKLTLSYPDENTQKTLIDFFSKLDNKIMKEENTLDFLTDLKEGLLQQIFI